MKIHRTKRGYTVFGVSKNDLSALVTILSNVGGNPDGPRGVSERMRYAAEKTGVSWKDEAKKHKMDGIIYIERA